MARFPQDQFDAIPADLTRVGAHRAPARRGRGLAAFGWILLSTIVLAAAGLFALTKVLPDFTLEIPGFGPVTTPAPEIPPLEAADPVTDPKAVPEELELSISVLNATATAGLANVAGDQIADAGWPDPVRANASSTDADETVIYYHSADFEGIARGLAELLGTGRVVLSDFFPGAEVTVVLGADYSA